MFLETITVLENDALVPINRIACINTDYSIENTWSIKIIGDDGNWQEHFKDENSMTRRYQQIKDIIGAK